MKKAIAKKFDTSAMISNLAVLSAALVVSLPLLLGDQLVVVASKVANESSIVVQDLANSLLGLFT